MKGKKEYVPGIVIDELDDMKTEYGLNQDARAFEKMVDYTRVGREVERIMRLDMFGHKPTRKKKFKGLF